jgi:competence ComEA-like helix-hairpin-helix protein
MPIDPSRPFFVRRMIVDPKNGNVYPALPKPYDPGTVPEYLLKDDVCSQEGVAPVPPAVPNVEIKEPTVDVSLQKPQVETSEVKPEIGGVDNPKQKLKADQEKLKINSATAAEISDFLDGVGPNTAEKLVKDRENKGGFINIASLNDRVRLGFGLSWDKFSEVIEF